VMVSMVMWLMTVIVTMGKLLIMVMWMKELRYTSLLQLSNVKNFSIYVKWHILGTVTRRLPMWHNSIVSQTCHRIPLLGCPWLLQVSPRPQSAPFLPLCFWPSGWWLVGFPWWLWACAGTEELCPTIGYTLYHPHRLQRGSRL
jgi:hypothetical protein